VEDLNEKIMNFINKVRPRLTMGELQVVAALALYLTTGDDTDIPGERSRT